MDFIDLVTHMTGLGPFEREYEHVRRMELQGERVPVLALNRIIVSKRAADRPKDRAVLPILEDLARTVGLHPDQTGD